MDLLGDTPLLDIKTYVPEFDAHPASKAGWPDVAQVGRETADNRFHGRLRPAPARKRR